MDPIGFVIFIVRGLLNFLLWSIIISAILSWLVAFNVINIRNPVANQIVRMLEAITRPVLRPIQRVIPPLGGVDISPIIAILIIQGLLLFIVRY